MFSADSIYLGVSLSEPDGRSEQIAGSYHGSWSFMVSNPLPDV